MGLTINVFLRCCWSCDFVQRGNNALRCPGIKRQIFIIDGGYNFFLPFNYLLLRCYHVAILYWLTFCFYTVKMQWWRYGDNFQMHLMVLGCSSDLNMSRSWQSQSRSLPANIFQCDFLYFYYSVDTTKFHMLKYFCNTQIKTTRSIVQLQKC